MIDYGYCQSELAWGDTYCNETNIRRILDGIREIGGSRIRFIAAWDLVDRNGQPYNWTILDRAVNLSVEHGLKPLLCMSVGNGRGGDGSAAAYGRWCGATAQRYGPAGSNQVEAYEIWNEENWSLFFQPTDPAAYVAMLKPAYTAIKAVHSSATVITGGTACIGTGMGFGFTPIPPFFQFAQSINPLEWASAVYNAGAQGYFDAYGYHWYTGTDQFTTERPATTQLDYVRMQGVRDLMVSKGDGAKQIWITEIGYAYPTVTPLTKCRDWLKLQVDMIAERDWLGPFYHYNFRASGTDTNNQVNQFGVVDFNYHPKSPYYEYCATIRGTDTDDITPPAPPTDLVVGVVTATTAALTWGAATDNVGVTGYRVYLADGTKVADTPNPNATITSLVPGNLYGAYVTAIDAATNESDPTDTVEFTTDSPSGLQAFYEYNFIGTGSALPTVFTQLNPGFAVTADVALHNAAGSDGIYYTVAPYNLDQQSPDHFSEISQAAASQYPDRAALAVVRLLPDGSEWVAALIHGGGQADACKIITCIAGVIQVRDAVNASPLLTTEKLRCTAVGNTYTASRLDANNAEEPLLMWTDTDGVFGGVNNRRTGIGWQHIRSGAANYPAPGITGLWRGFDVAPVAPSGGVADAWTLAVADDDDWPIVIATGLWEATV